MTSLPFWSPFFARLGYEVVPSQPSSQTTLQAGLRRLPAETCLPIKLAFGHVQELVEAGVDRIFLPSILTRSGDDARFSHSCPYVQAVPYMVKAALSASFLTPEVHLSRGEDAFVAGLAPALSELGVGRHEIAEAYRDASAAWAEFRRQIVDAGREVLDAAGRAIVVIGKPYNVLDPYLNLNLLKHLRRLGVTAIPMWYLPIEDVELDPQSDRLPWHLNRMIVRAVRYCQRDDRLFPVLVSNFGCGPDAFTQMHLEQMLDGRPSLVLEFDEHRAEAGLVTRLEAFLDEIEEPRNQAGPAAPWSSARCSQVADSEAESRSPIVRHPVLLGPCVRLLGRPPGRGPCGARPPASVGGDSASRRGEHVGEGVPPVQPAHRRPRAPRPIAAQRQRGVLLPRDNDPVPPSPVRRGPSPAPQADERV